VEAVETEVTRRRFTADEYHRMGEAGILAENERIELINGGIVEMSPIGGRHMAIVNRLTRLLVNMLGDDAVVSIQNPVRLGPHDEPQPDVALLARQPADQVPTTVDVLLLIEVADTTLAYDRRVKLPLYARTGVAEVWIVDVASGTIERHSDPAADGYRLVQRVGKGQTLRLSSLPALELPVDSILL